MFKPFAIVILFSGVVWAAESKSDISLTSWMSGLDDAKLITQISIPGTHDSAADFDHCYEETVCKELILFNATQTYTIAEQLSKGGPILRHSACLHD